jgi:hypothetical protein
MDSVIQVLSGFGGMGLGNVGLESDEVTLNGLAATEPAPLATSAGVGGKMGSLAVVALLGFGFWLMRPRGAHLGGLNDHVLHFKDGGTARIKKRGRNRHFEARRRGKSGMQLTPTGWHRTRKVRTALLQDASGHCLNKHRGSPAAFKKCVKAYLKKHR